MSLGRDRRLARLERRRGKKKIALVWYDPSRETAAQARARRYPEGVPAGARLIYISWQWQHGRTQSAAGPSQAGGAQAVGE